MKKLFLFFVCLTFSSTGFAAEIMQPYVEVFGKSTIEVEPDTMIWRLDITTKDDDLNSVSEQHSQTVSDVLQIIRSKNVEKNTIQTSRMSFGENRIYQSKSWIKKGYIAKTSVVFKLQELQNYQPLWMSLSKVKGVSINDVKYDHSDRVSFRNKARKQALLAAKDKAQIMAETLDVAIGRPISISEIGYNYSSSGSNMISFDVSDAASSSSISLGTIPISMKVKLVIGIIAK